MCIRDRLISHRFAQDQTRAGPTPPSPPVGRVTEWLSSLSSPAIPAVGPDHPLNDDDDEIMPRRDDTTVRRSHRSQKSKKSKASKSRKTSRRDDPPRRPRHHRISRHNLWCQQRSHTRLRSLVRTAGNLERTCLLYTSPSPRDLSTTRMPSSA